MTAGFFAILLFALICITLMAGYPVAFTLAGVSLWIAGLTSYLGLFDFALMNALPSRIFGIMTNQTLLAVPLFIFMGITLEKSKIADQLLINLSRLFRKLPGGLALSVTLVGVLLAASTGIVGATVVTMGLLALPTFLKNDYPHSLACGTICATGTLGQIIPPSIALVLLGDVLSNAYQQVQIRQGSFSPATVSVGDLFVGAVLPGLILVFLYCLYLLWRTRKLALGNDQAIMATQPSKSAIFIALIPPLSLMILVLGSIIVGWATPTEAAGVGACGALVLAILKKQLNIHRVSEICTETAKITSMVFMILVGASIFSLVFKGLGGDVVIETWFAHLPGGLLSAVFAVMLLIFLLGFILDFIEITYVVVPIVGPILMMMGADPVWLGIVIAINLQTSFLTPPFGFSLFYLRGVAPPKISTGDIYRGVIPFIVIQLIVLGVLLVWPDLATWLPNKVS
jgi:tripartite ATP-independent transporter DctM subunit